MRISRTRTTSTAMARIAAYNRRMSLRRAVALLVFASLLASFLSPAFAWQMKASHAELAHHGVVDHGPDHGHDHDHDHHPGGPGHADPHSLIGHLFSHLPMLPTQIAAWAPPAEAGFTAPAVFVRIAVRVPEPPFRPPRS